MFLKFYVNFFEKKLLFCPSILITDAIYTPFQPTVCSVNW